MSEPDVNKGPVSNGNRTKAKGARPYYDVGASGVAALLEARECCSNNPKGTGANVTCTSYNL